MQSIKVIGLSIWVFVNLTLLGLLVYVYLLWSVYWKSVPQGNAAVLLETSIQKSPGGGLIAGGPNWRSGRMALAAATSGGRPRYFWNDTVMLSRLAPVPTDKLQNKVETYKSQLIVKLRQSQLDAANVLNGEAKADAVNAYNVQYEGRIMSNKGAAQMPNGGAQPAETSRLLCKLKNTVPIRFLDKGTEPFGSLKLGHMFPDDAGSVPKWSQRAYNTCAVVSSAGSLYKSQLGPQIDKHDAILRFNNAPTNGFQDDVGSKTTFRILNSQVVYKPEFHFLEDPLYKNITLFAWDPSNYTVDLHQWYNHPDFDLFSPYAAFRTQNPDSNFYIIHPQMIWDAWEFLQSFTAIPIMRHPPSSGFIGLVMMAHLCGHVDIYEYIPSMRLTKRCHYYDVHENMGCTFGAWHPLGSEKLLALVLHSGNDMDVFDSGFLRIQGVDRVRCAPD